MAERTESSVQVPAGLELRRWPPRFLDPEVEKAYRREYAAELQPHVRFGLLTATAAWLLVIPLGIQLSPGAMTPRIILGMVILAGLIGTASLAGALVRPLLNIPWFTAFANSVTGLACVALGYGVFNHPVLTMGGLLVTMMYAASFFRLTTLSALAATLPYLILFQVLILTDPSLRGVDASVLSELLWLTEMCTVSAAYVNENSARRAFIQRRIIDRQAIEIEGERAKSDRLILNVLPAAIAVRLRQKQETIAETYPEVTILFSDVVGFTPLADKLPPAELVSILNQLFSRFDELAARHGLEKIKTIGDAYMAAAGVPLENPDHASAAAQMALGMLEAVEALNGELGLTLEVRIGLNTGAVVAGVIGKQKFSFDLWGDAVNTAARMESHGLPGMIQLTEATRAKLGSHFILEDRGLVEVKGKGGMRTYFLLRSSPSR